MAIGQFKLMKTQKSPSCFCCFFGKTATEFNGEKVRLYLNYKMPSMTYNMQKK